MPTQEERLAALEQKTASHIQEMDENFTIMVGVIRHQGQDIKRIFQRLETIDESLDSYNQQLDTANQRLGTMDVSLHVVNQRLEMVDQRLDTIDQHLGTVNQRLENVDGSMHAFKHQLNDHTSLLTQILARLP
jgi:chromosome segregation ATPase